MTRRSLADNAADAQPRLARAGVTRPDGSVKRLLMIAFHFPPMTGSSGAQRTLQFARHLPQFGWEPIILTANARAYEQTSDASLRDLPERLVVKRAFALDTAQQMSLFRRYPAFMARPDRWISWWPAAVLAGLRLVRKYRVSAIWSTYPIATAHLIGKTIARRADLPWIADFRDPMAQLGYPSDPITWKHFQRIEESTLREAVASIFVTPGAVRAYRDRYPNSGARLQLIENGFDEEAFLGLQPLDEKSPPLNPGALTLLHSGLVYPSERNPNYLFTALAQLHQTGAITPSSLRIRFRASGHDNMIRHRASAAGVLGYIDLAPSLPYREALAEMTRADALLIMQSKGCDDQIPAKFYEYCRARRPILALCNPTGDTAKKVREFGLDAIAPLESSEEIAAMLPAFLHRVRCGSASLPDFASTKSASRLGRTRMLAELLESVT